MYNFVGAESSVRRYSCALSILCLSSTIIVVALLCLTMSSCTPSLKAGPDRLVQSSDELRSIKTQYGKVDFGYYNRLNPQERISFRNNLIAGRMYAIDLQYSSYEASLTNEQQALGFLSSSTSNALTTTATLVSPAVTKTVLAGTATFINASSANYNDSVLFKQTTQLLQAQMRANRANVASRIIARMRQSDSGYPLAFALSDVEEYYRAGTLPGALIKANATVSAAEDWAQSEKDAAISYTLNREDAAVLVRNSLVVNGKYDAVQARKLEALLLMRGIKQRLEIVISNPRYSAETAQLARDAGLLK